MGKWTDKNYITHSEWTRDFGGVASRKTDGYKRLPFNFCALSLAAFENPVCTEDGSIFDLLHIVPFVQKFGVNPVTGAPLALKDLTKLHFHKTEKGELSDPITFKTFNENTHLVAVKVSGNVYEAETVERLNAKTKNWRDLLTDEPFTRKDLIDLHDPSRLDYRHNFAQFYHVVNKLSVNAEVELRNDRQRLQGKPNAAGATEEAQRRKDPTSHINVSSTTARILSKAGTLAEFKPPPSMQREAALGESDAGASAGPAKTAAHFSTGRMAASFTSTAVQVAYKDEAAQWNADDVMYERIKKKGYVRLLTTLGPLSLELHCDLTPMTAHNFILLCKRGYYNGVEFHRSIKHFMLQGGDPTGTGTGGESAWKTHFKDEFRYNLSHDGRGVVSMANKGADTNSSQFFITYKSCKHLDRKHTIFGKLVGGMETLDKIEAVETDAKDRPKQSIKIVSAEVFVDPYDDYAKVEAEAVQKAEKETALIAEKERQEKGEERGAWFSNPSNRQAPEPTPSDVVGRYLNSGLSASTTQAAPTQAALEDDAHDMYSQQKKRKMSGKTGFSDFSAW